jgi:hypothetical protein
MSSLEGDWILNVSRGTHGDWSILGLGFGFSRANMGVPGEVAG